ncbi:MAG TPA: hypothetical protein PKC18_03155, partial [Lacipirellulaceae bacterium]|nr:hypothetical protein [Lacipirellulaceae bacterium]
MRALLTVLAVLAAAAPTSASLLIYEPFNYPSGANLNGQVNASTGGQWLKSGSNPSGDNQSISSTPLSYPGLQPGAGLSLFTPRLSAANNTANRLTMPSAPYTRAAGGSLFYSFTYRLLEWDAISDSGAKNATHRKGGLIAGFHGGVANTATGMGNAAAFAGTVWVRRAIDYSQTGTDG